MFVSIVLSLLGPAAWAEGNLHFQTTTVSQEHGAFRSPYQGVNSLTPERDNQTSVTATVFAGFKLGQLADLFVNPELAGGSGFSRTTGIAGFPNGEIYRVDDPGPKWNLARFYLKHSFGFGGEQEEVKDNNNQLARTTDVRRLTVVLGKFALNDFFDNNSYSHDPRTQFLNWTLMDYGAWDYAADTKGYSWGLYLEFNQPHWTARWASVMVPLRANQLQMDRNFPAARGDNFEFEYRYAGGTARWLLFQNYARMGNYRATINDPVNNLEVSASRALSSKYGAGFSLEQALSTDLGGFFRASWNDGRTETWAFTEIDRSVTVGLSLKGGSWTRSNDTAGVALIANALAPDHRDYIAEGGHGFILGDGHLNYAVEQIGEVYYLWKLKDGFDLTGDFQFVANPAYNADRGPVMVSSLRLHYEM